MGLLENSNSWAPFLGSLISCAICHWFRVSSPQNQAQFVWYSPINVELPVCYFITRSTSNIEDLIWAHAHALSVRLNLAVLIIQAIGPPMQRSLILASRCTLLHLSPSYSCFVRVVTCINSFWLNTEVSSIYGMHFISLMLWYSLVAY